MEFTKRQEEIIEKSILIIGLEGMQGLTTKRLAEEMNFSEPALYRHFKNKTEILNSVLKYYQSFLAEGLLALLNNKKTGLEKILGVIEYQFNTFIDRPEIILVIFSESSFQNNSVLLNTVSRTMEKKESKLTNMIEYGKQDESIRPELDAASIAKIIMGSMRFVALKWKMSNFKFDLKKESIQLQQSITLMIKNK